MSDQTTEWTEHGSPRLRSRYVNGRTWITDADGDNEVSIRGMLTQLQIEEVWALYDRAFRHGCEAGAEQRSAEIRKLIGARHTAED